jgi:hypothetical protein
LEDIMQSIILYAILAALVIVIVNVMLRRSESDGGFQFEPIKVRAYSSESTAKGTVRIEREDGTRDIILKRLLDAELKHSSGPKRIAAIID